MKQTTLALPLALSLVLVSCAEAKFSDKSEVSNSAESVPVNAEGATGVVGPENRVAIESVGPSQCEIEGDMVSINPRTETIIDCIEKGMLYHFQWKKCTPVPVAESFACDSFDAVKSAVSQINLSTALLDKAAAEGAKLIGCGEKNDGNTIVVQWWYPQDNGCRLEGSATMTVCFRQYLDRDPPPPPTNRQERQMAVRRCIEE